MVFREIHTTTARIFTAVAIAATSLSGTTPSAFALPSAGSSFTNTGGTNVSTPQVWGTVANQVGYSNNYGYVTTAIPTVALPPRVNVSTPKPTVTYVPISTPRVTDTTIVPTTVRPTLTSTPTLTARPTVRTTPTPTPTYTAKPTVIVTPIRPTQTRTPAYTPTVSAAQCSVNNMPSEEQMNRAMPLELRVAEAIASNNPELGACNFSNTSSCNTRQRRLLDRLSNILEANGAIPTDSQEAFNFSSKPMRQLGSTEILNIFEPNFVALGGDKTSTTQTSTTMFTSAMVQDTQPAPRRKVTIRLYTDPSFCAPCRVFENTLWVGLGMNPAELTELYRQRKFEEAAARLRTRLIEAFSKVGIDVDFTTSKTGSPSGTIPHLLIDQNKSTAQDILNLLAAAQVPGGGQPQQPKPTDPQQPRKPSLNGKCDAQQDEWGCFCIYSPPGGPYNEGGEKRFKDACLNAMGDPNQPERWKEWYNCKEIKTFKMEGATGNTSFPGFQEWLQAMANGTPPVKCFRGFMYSHSNGYKNFVDDRTKPISQCISVGSGINCFSLHDCGCSTAKNAQHICSRALEIQKELEAANSNMVVHFDAANEDQALPGGLHVLDKAKMCAANPDGHVVDEYYWRRAAVTRKGVFIYRHVKENGTSKWQWVKMSPAEFKNYCAGIIK